MNNNFLTSSNQPIILPTEKRLFDIIISLLILIISSPIFFLISILILLEHLIIGETFAPLFYTETRISQGKPFSLLKFNIFRQSVIEKMKESKVFVHTKNLEKDGDSLIRTGYFLIQVYLDELPQLINVLKGEISLVGPRPVNLEVYNNILKRGITTKTRIKAGITGNFQSLKGITVKTDVELDEEYIDFCLHNPGYKILWNDTKILLRTLKVIVRARGI